MKFQIVIDTNLHSLADRLAIAADYRTHMRDTVVSITTGQTFGSSFYGIVFYEPSPEPKEPAKVVSIDGCRFHSSPEPAHEYAYAQSKGPGGCVSVPESGTHVPILGTEKSLSEQMEEILEPRPWDHAPVAVNKHGKE